MNESSSGLPCVCYEDGSSACVCGPLERKLHHVINYGATLTPEERTECAREIAHTEGYTDQDANGTDEQIAHTVLAAWTDYCRDKGLI